MYKASDRRNAEKNNNKNTLHYNPSTKLFCRELAKAPPNSLSFSLLTLSLSSLTPRTAFKSSTDRTEIVSYLPHLPHSSLSLSPLCMYEMYFSDMSFFDFSCFFFFFLPVKWWLFGCWESAGTERNENFDFCF